MITIQFCTPLSTELSKKRKNDTGVVAEDSSGEKRSKRDKSDAVTSPNSSNSKREKKNDRKRVSQYSLSIVMYCSKVLI